MDSNIEPQITTIVLNCIHDPALPLAHFAVASGNRDLVQRFAVQGEARDRTAAAAGKLTQRGGGQCDCTSGSLLSDEESQELFEANLPLGGVLPLRVELAFQSGVPVELKKARFRLRDEQNREWKLLSPKSAISRIMKANGVTLYNPNSRKQFEQEFGAYAIDLKTPLSSSDPRRQGFLFFQTPDK